MKKTVLREYARLIVRCGVNVQKGQDVVIYADLDQPEFVKMLVEEAYKAKARKVTVEWDYPELAKLHVRYQSVKTMGTVEAWKEAKQEHFCQTLPARIHLESSDPDGLKGINMEKVSKARQMSYPILKPYRDPNTRHYFDNESLVLHRPQDGLSVAENFLCSIRPDKKFSEAEARLLDLCLVLHMDHGGGNNSAFACRVLSSSGTDIYSAIAAAVGSLKGPRHGGANKKVMEMFGHIERDVKDWSSDDEVAAYLEKILKKEAGDRSGLIYGMGHAIYTLSDPRAVMLKRFAREVAEERGFVEELELFERVEKLAPEVFHRVTGQNKVMCANVDLYSGLVYKMMGIPPELYTPLFAIARIVGWCAHRVEEVYNPSGRIIRPAYKAVCPMRDYVPLENR